MRLPRASSLCGLAWGPLLLGLCRLLVATQPQLVREGLGGMGQVGKGAWAGFSVALLPSRAALSLPHSSLSPPPLEGAPISH